MLYEHSRYTYCDVWTDEQQRLFTDARVPYRYRPFPDNSTHTVKMGETLFTIAGHQFAPHPRAAGLWWIIADFQPQPIVDPTIALKAGASLILPSLQRLQTDIFSEARRRESRV